MQQQPNMLIAFLQELFQRFATKSPTFFKIIQLITGLLAAVAGLPTILTSWGIHVPDILFGHETSKLIAACSTGALFISFLTTQSKPTGIDENGNVVKQTNADKLPFTAAKETKQAIKTLNQ